MLEAPKQEASRTLTESGTEAYRINGINCLEMFTRIKTMRDMSERKITEYFERAFAENPYLAMKILFYARDVRGGLGERYVFRTCLKWLAEYRPNSVRMNIGRIAEYGRWDDLFVLEGTSCEGDMLRAIRKQLSADIAALETDGSVSLLAKWMPSVNASCAKTVRRAKRFARYLGMTEPQYRRALVRLRERIRIIENNLREKDYTFDYAVQPSKALFKYRETLNRHDGERYRAFLKGMKHRKEEIPADMLARYEIITQIFRCRNISEETARALDAAWHAQEDFANDENALVVLDGCVAMYGGVELPPASVALSLGIYFAERKTGAFRNQFITLSRNPQLVEIKGNDIVQKAKFCMGYDEFASVGIHKVFDLILSAAVTNNVPKEEMPSTLYIISWREFDSCVKGVTQTYFEYAKQLFAQHGYQLPRVVFWNVAARNRQQPVTQNEQGVVLVSGCTPRIFGMLKSGSLDPYAFMMQVLSSERYRNIAA